MKRYIHSSFIILHSSLKKGSSLRKVIYASFIILHASLFLSSCTDTLFEAQGYVQEGLPATLRIGVQAEQGIQVTRAAADPTLEETVHSLFVFIFDEDGDKRLGLFISSDQLQNDSQGAYVTINTTSMNNATVVCIANATESGYAITTEHLQRVGTLAHLQAAWETLDDRSVERVNYFLMTATATKENNTKINIAPGANRLDAKLQRVDAKVTFNVGLGNQLPADWENASFLPRQWRVCQVPLNTYLMPHTDEDGTPCDYDERTDENDYFYTEQIPFESLTRDDATQRYTGGTFTFYMPENLKQPRQPVSDYAQRDAWEGQDDNGLKHFTYANAHSTYVEMTGTLTYSTKDYSMVSVDVKLTVHLGHDSDTNPNDYLTRRNHHYTYNVDICGIDDILVEVGNDKEDLRPGYEGNVVYNNKEIFNLDSHYDRCLLRISPQEIGEGMTWSVRTPFSTGTHDATQAQAETGLEDYRWLKFVINRAHDVSRTEYARYPGDHKYAPDTTDPASLNAWDLMDIHQLTRYLMHVKQQDVAMSELTMRAPNGEDSIYITAYVDEYLYHEHPQQPGLSEAEKLLLWKESVDREDRQMHLIIPLEGSAGGSYSDDLQSSVIRSLYSFNQRSIRTIFDADNPDLTTAWGLESVMETDDNSNGGRLPVGDIPRNATSTDNGRANTLLWTEGESWYEIMQTSPRYGLAERYNNALYACLLRNRDLNGDGTIQNNEVRWYLASIDQLTDIFIGEAALDEEAQLYPRNAVDRPGGNSVYWHYTSSSYDASDGGGPWVLWAEEGASVGSYNDSKPKDKNGSYYAYRCIRNLGIPLDQPGQVPQNLVEVDKDDDGYLIDMSRMNPKARRTSRANGSLPNHTERDPENRPYVSFHVDKGTYPEPEYERPIFSGSFTFTNAQQWSYYQDPNHNPCPLGYRLPNQRELLIMSTRMEENAWPEYTGTYLWYSSSSKARYMSQTAFSLDGKSPYNDQRDGFIWDAQSEKFMLRNNDDEKGYVRCVRDVE